MTTKPHGSKGLELEETLRNYFLRANFYVLRSVPLKIENEELSDIDIWLYERPSGFARRRLIVDAKFKNKPRAAERLFWTKGICEFLKVDAGYVATTDSRPIIRQIAHRVGIGIFDGKDLARIAGNEKVEALDRLNGDEFGSLVRQVDQAQMNKEWTTRVADAKASILHEFGVTSANVCLGEFSYFAEQAIQAHPGSLKSHLAVRCAYFTASMAAVSLDFVANEGAFRTASDRNAMLANGIRFGNVDKHVGTERVRFATTLVEQFVDGGSGLSHQISNRYFDAVQKIPAEIVSDLVSRMSQKDGLFVAARELEYAAYQQLVPGFDVLAGNAKSLAGSFLDFCGLSRQGFADAVGREAGHEPVTNIDTGGIAEPGSAEYGQLTLDGTIEAKSSVAGDRKIGKKSRRTRNK